MSSRALVIPLVVASMALGGCGKSSPPRASEATDTQLVQAGLLAVQQGDDVAALHAFSTAADKQPKNFYAQYNVGVLLQKKGQTDRALAAYGRSLTANPSYVPALFNEATLFGLSNPALAIDTYLRVIKLQPKAPTAYLNLGLLEAKIGLFDRARSDLSTAIKQDGTLVSAVPKNVFSGEHPTAPSPSATR